MATSVTDVEVSVIKLTARVKSLEDTVAAQAELIEDLTAIVVRTINVMNQTGNE